MRVFYDSVDVPCPDCGEITHVAEVEITETATSVTIEPTEQYPYCRTCGDFIPWHCVRHAYINKELADENPDH